MTTTNAVPAREQPVHIRSAENFTPFYLLVNCRRLLAMKYRSKQNWIIAMELFAIGSTSAWQVCVEAGIDPDGLTVVRLDTTTSKDT